MYKSDYGINIAKPSVCEADLAGVIVLGVEQITELRQQFRPGLQLSFRGDGRDQDTLMIESREGHTRTNLLNT